MNKVDLSKAVKQLQAEKPVSSSTRPDRAGKKGVVLHLPVDLWRSLKILAAKQDTTLQALGIRAIEDSLFQNLNESELGAVAIRLQACVVPVLASVLLAGFADAGM